jgi:hypothetical protein
VIARQMRQWSVRMVCETGERVSLLHRLPVCGSAQRKKDLALPGYSHAQPTRLFRLFVRAQKSRFSSSRIVSLRLLVGLKHHEFVLLPVPNRRVQGLEYNATR